MTSDDFYNAIAPMLESLQDDPSRSLPGDLETTTLPSGGEEISGQITESDIEGEWPIFADLEPSDEDIEAGRRAYRESGIDVLAFYKSFRFRDRPPCRGKWGIFLLDTGISVVEAEYAKKTDKLPRSELRQLAIDTLLAHERYHFWIDVWALGQETLPFSTPVKRYEYYLAGRRDAAFMRFDYEESLANHYSYIRLKSRKLSDGSRAGRLIKELFLEAPEPYSNFDFGAPERAWREGMLALAVSNGVNPVVTITMPADTEVPIIGSSIRPVYGQHPAVGYQACPVHILMVTGYAGWAQPFQGPQLREFRHFIERYLAGEKEPTSDHDYYRIDNGEKVKFPNPHDKEIRGYELKGTLLKAGMTQAEFRNARESTRRWTRNCPRSQPKAPLTA